MKRSWSPPKSSSNVTSLIVVVADPVPSSFATTVCRGIVTGAILPASTSAHVPPPWKWLMCLTPSSGSPFMFNSTFTPPSTFVRVAVPLTPESRSGVSWRSTFFVSWAKALPPSNRDATNAAPRMTPTRRFTLYTIFPFRYALTYELLSPSGPPWTHLAMTMGSLIEHFDRLVVSGEHLIRFLQVSRSLVNMTVILIELGLGGSGGIGSQLIG